MINQDILKLKNLVSELDYTGDDLVFDKLLGEIDSVIYRLRTACFPKRQNNPVLQALEDYVERENEMALAVKWDDILSDISAGLKEESEDEGVSNRSRNTH